MGFVIVPLLVFVSQSQRRKPAMNVSLNMFHKKPEG